MSNSSDDSKKVLELEKEFRTTVISELSNIKKTQEEIQDLCDDLDKKVSLFIQKTDFELINIKRLDERQNELIDEHIRGVKRLDQLVDQQKTYFDKKIDILERPRLAFETLEKWLLRIGAIAGAGYGFSKFIGWF
jgi:hypothetical protein